MQEKLQIDIFNFYHCVVFHGMYVVVKEIGSSVYVFSLLASKVWHSSEQPDTV